MPDLSYQEKSLYGTLVVELAVYVPYFIYAAGHRASFLRIVGTVIVLIVLQIVLQGILAAVTRNRLKDERDKLIELRGFRVGYYTLVSGVLLGLGLLWGHVLAGKMPADLHHFANHLISVLFCMFVVAELAKTFAQILAYRSKL